MKCLIISIELIFILSGTANSQVKAFPSAEGYGANTVGGRGGTTIIKVTNLNDSGPGSLRAAMEAIVPRTIVFDVSGTINLTNDIILDSTNSYMTIAGQTSPGGVQIKGGPGGAGGSIVLTSGIHDVIIRHLRIRPGGPPPYPSAIGGAADAQGNIILYGTTPAVNNIIVDHSSLQWSGGKTINTYGTVTNTTWQWNIIASGLPTPVSGCTPGLDCSASYGVLVAGFIGGDLITTTIHHNLIAHFGGRVPLFQRSGTAADFRNNVVYNWGSNLGPMYDGSQGAYFGSFINDHSAFVNMVNNHYIAGPNTDPAPNQTFIVANGGPLRDRGGTKIYVSGNWGQLCPLGCIGDNDWNLSWIEEDTGYLACPTGTACETRYKVATPFNTPPVTTTPTANLKSVVTATVGAYKPSRDSTDTTVINDVNNLTGNMASIGNGGPWPTLTGGAPLLDTDGDGMPDVWEIAHGLNPNVPDGHLVAANGYTNLENYLNELAGDIIP